MVDFFRAKILVKSSSSSDRPAWPEVGGMELFLRKSMMQCHLKFLEASRKKYDAISSDLDTGADDVTTSGPSYRCGRQGRTRVYK